MKFYESHVGNRGQRDAFSSDDAANALAKRYAVMGPNVLLVVIAVLVMAFQLSSPACAQNRQRIGVADTALQLVEVQPLRVIPFNKVFIVVGENEGYDAVIANAAAPYMNSLAAQYGYAESYYANTHPSIGNYFMLTTGQIITNDDKFVGTVDVDNIVRDLVAAGLSWKCYAESIPYAGYLGGNSGLYFQHHVPFTYLSDVVNDPLEAANIVPFSQLATDIENNTLPDYGFIVPNFVDDGHGCPASDPSCTNAQKVTDFDDWLQTNIQPLLSSTSFSTSGLLVITFDEGSASDTTYGGGQVPWIAVSSSSNLHHVMLSPVSQHQNTLRLMGTSLGLTSLPGLAASGPDLNQFFY